MSLGISKMIVTPMQRLIIRITPADVAPIRYEIALKRESNGDIVTDQFTGVSFRSQQLYAPENYEVTIQAVYADPADNEIYQHPELISIDPKESMATTLRQSVWDILFGAELELDGRPMYSFSDGWCRPAVLRKGETPDMRTPAAEVGMPVLRQTAFASGCRKVEEWRLPIRLLDDIHKEDSDQFARVWHLAEQVQAAVDQTDNINLGCRGVLDKAWSWRIMEDPDQERDRMSGLKLWLTVHVQREIGAIGR